MSEIATARVWSASRSRRGSRLVMLALAREADDQGKATVTLDAISKLTGLTTRGITKCLGDLAALGELTHQSGGGASNPNSYRILLLDRTEVPTNVPRESEVGTSFQDTSSQNAPASRNLVHAESELSSSGARGGSTPYGSTTTTQKQASLPRSSRKHHGTPQDSVTVPEEAKELVAAMSSAGMLVGWRLTESEWSRVTELVGRWGHERLVDMVAGRWNAERPPQSARYLLRIWADLPAESPVTASPGNVVPLHRRPGGWMPFQNAANTSAYENGF